MNTQLMPAENTLMQAKEAITALIPAESFDKFRTFIASASLDNPDLNLATHASITRAFIDCANIGLMPDGQEAAIVTRKDHKAGTIIATFQPMVKGVVRVINSSPEIRSFHVKAVYQGDDFKMWSDETGDHFTLNPAFGVDRGDKDITLFYASAVLANGTVIIEVMTRSQIDKHMACAKQPYIWKAWYSEMGIKTIIHRILKRLPVSNPEIVQGLEHSLDLDLNKAPEKVEKPLEYCSPEKFTENTAAWKALIESGKKDANSLIATLETKTKLTDEQKLEIASWELVEAEYMEESA
jgi:recombination protein RecT